MTARAAGNNNDPPAIVAPTRLEFQITDTKLHILVVSLPKENYKKLLEQLKSGFKRTVKWNKYRLQMTIQPQNNNFNYLIDQCLLKLTDCCFVVCKNWYRDQIIEILFQAIMYQMSE